MNILDEQLLKGFKEAIISSTEGVTGLVSRLHSLKVSGVKSELVSAKKVFLEETLKTLGYTFEDSSVEETVEEEPQQPSQETTDEYIARKFLSVLNSAEKRGKEFNLTLKEVKKLLSRKTCYYTGVTLVNYSEEDPVDNARTFDRIDNEQGYVIGNVVACSHWSNQLKNTLFESPKGLALGKELLVKKLLEKML